MVESITRQGIMPPTAIHGPGTFPRPLSCLPEGCLSCYFLERCARYSRPWSVSKAPSPHRQMIWYLHYVTYVLAGPGKCVFAGCTCHCICRYTFMGVVSAEERQPPRTESALNFRHISSHPGGYRLGIRNNEHSHQHSRHCVSRQKRYHRRESSERLGSSSSSLLLCGIFFSSCYR